MEGKGLTVQRARERVQWLTWQREREHEHAMATQHDNHWSKSKPHTPVGDASCWPDKSCTTFTSLVTCNFFSFLFTVSWFSFSGFQWNRLIYVFIIILRYYCFFFFCCEVFFAIYMHIQGILPPKHTYICFVRYFFVYIHAYLRYLST